jgi:hypothetical protein
MWLVIMQRCGDYEGPEFRSVELLGADGSLIERKVLEPPKPMETTTRIVLCTGSDADPIVDHPWQPEDLHPLILRPRSHTGNHYLMVRAVGSQPQPAMLVAEPATKSQSALTDAEPAGERHAGRFRHAGASGGRDWPAQRRRRAVRR